MFCVHIQGQNELLWRSGGKKMSNLWEARGVRERIMDELASDFVFEGQEGWAEEREEKERVSESWHQVITGTVYPGTKQFPTGKGKTNLGKPYLCLRNHQKYKLVYQFQKILKSL